MKRRTKQLTLITISLLIILTFAGCSNNSTKTNAYSIEQFTTEMKSKNYDFELKDAKENFLPTIRKRLLTGNEAIDIYLYRNDKAMEEDSKRIDSGGCSYSDENKSVKVSWASLPHFYKKGNIIVQYVGENKKIISDLKDILGEQFAGYK